MAPDPETLPFDTFEGALSVSERVNITSPAMLRAQAFQRLKFGLL